MSESVIERVLVGKRFLKVFSVHRCGAEVALVPLVKTVVVEIQESLEALSYGVKF